MGVILLRQAALGETHLKSQGTQRKGTKPALLHRVSLWEEVDAAE